MKKIIGWCLLISGIVIIGWAIWNSYQIFMAQKPSPAIFEMPEKKISISQPAPEKTSVLTQEKMQEKMVREIKETIGEQLGKMMPSDFMVKILNLVSWSIFAGILILAGGKISEIGIKLL